MDDVVATTGAETDTGDAGTGDDAGNETILTGAADNGDTGTESDGDASASADGADAEGDATQGDGDAGAEGSDGASDSYADFVMPEGMTLDEAALAEATPIFKELGLTQEQAQKLIDLQAGQVQAGSQMQIDNFNQLKSDWFASAKGDSEYGGDSFDENAKVAQNAVNKYGTPELKQLLDEHGVGNHPELIRFMVRVGQTLKEDVPGTSGTASSAKADRIEVLYPTKK